MRVRISYGIDVKEIPVELEHLFRHVLEKHHQSNRLVRLIEECLSDDDVESVVNSIEKLRVSLAEIDNRLVDISNIATGYVNYKQNEGVENVEQGRPSVDTTEDRPPDRNTKQSTGNPHNAGT